VRARQVETKLSGKKKTLATVVSLFSSQESMPNKYFCIRMVKIIRIGAKSSYSHKKNLRELQLLSASAHRQATLTGRISGAPTSWEDSITQCTLVKWKPHVYVPEDLGGFYA
jgi:hypothetical protein